MGRDLNTLCAHISDRERLAQKAQRASIKYKQAEFMVGNIGKKYMGIITSIADFGLFIMIKENGCDGVVRLSEMKGEQFKADVNNHQIKGKATGLILKIGDEVMVYVKHVDMLKREIEFILPLL